jgi:hypothetical protein
MGQIHFEDLEPHRFEDLVRALLYDFRVWRQLESTGRSGGDAGFDARGWELIDPEMEIGSEDEQEREGDLPAPVRETRLWLIQCKREKSIGPTALRLYLDDIAPEERPSLYGLIFAAACDFSKKARDAFHSKCREFGLAECFLWGKGDLEDMLIQPKNDPLLFAHFGFSLVVRQRSLRAELRSRIATKRKALKLFGRGEYLNRETLFRDPEDDRYPYTGDEAGDFKQPLKWFVRRVIEIDHCGLVVLYRDRLAYLADDGVSWDAIEPGDRAVPFAGANPWEHRGEGQTEFDQERRARSFWQKLPGANRARLEIRGTIPFEDILAIDEDGDNTTNVPLPQVFVKFSARTHPFKFGDGRVKVGERSAPNDPAHKVKFFPDELPEADPNESVPVE